MPGGAGRGRAQVDFQMDKVEEVNQAEDEADDGWETEYHQNKGKGLIRIRINANQMDDKLLALEALYSYADALGGRFHPAVQPVVGACVPLLAYKWSDKVRAQAANVLIASYKSLVLAGAEGAGGLCLAQARELLAALLKPLGDQLNKESSLEASDALLDAFREALVLERTHGVGALQPSFLSGLVQLTKRQLQLDEGRRKARTAAAAERGGDDDEEADADEAEEEEQEAELLTTCVAITIEILRQHGAAALPQVEAHLLPHFQPWLNVPADGVEGGALVRLALGIDVIAGVIEHTTGEVAKKYVSAALPLLSAHAEADDARLRRAAWRAFGGVAEHGGKLLTRNACAAMATRMAAALQAPTARYSAQVEASEAAALALGKMLVHRAASLDGASILPLWLGWLPLRRSEEDDARAAMGCLCTLLEADAAAVFGADGAAFPAVLGALAAAYESDGAGEAVSQRIKSLVGGWSASNQALLESGAAALPQPHLRAKIGRMAAV